MSGAWMVGPKGGLVRVPSDRPAPAGCKPLEVPMRTVAPASADPLATIVDATSARFAVVGTVHHATAEGLASLYVGAVLALEQGIPAGAYLKRGPVASGEARPRRTIPTPVAAHASPVRSAPSAFARPYVLGGWLR